MAKPLNKELLSLLIALVILCAIGAVNAVGQRDIKRQALCSSMRAGITQSFMNSIDGKIEAKAASVYDFTTGERVYSFNDTLPLPLASLTKLMTVRVAMKTVTEDTKYTVTPSDVKFDGATGFIPGDTYSVHDLLEGALIQSLNNAATMVAKSTGMTLTDFIPLMNKEAESLGLSSLHYGSVTGLDNDDLSPTVTGDAQDVLKLLYQDTMEMPNVMALGTLPTATIRAANGRTIALKNTDEDIGQIDLLKASKTGYTISAGGNLAVLWQEPRGDTLGAVVLGSSVEGRFTDILALHSAANQYREALRALPEYCTPVKNK